MQLHFRTERGAPVLPARLEFSMLTSVPDRPAGVQELCPVVTLDDDTISSLGHGVDIETATGAIMTPSGGWAIVNMRINGLGVIVALDLGDPVVKRMLNDAPTDGLLIGLLASTSARVVRIPVSDIVAVLRQRAMHAVPANLQEQGELARRLFHHLDGEGWPFERGAADDRQEPLYVALPIGVPAGAGLEPRPDGVSLH